MGAGKGEGGGDRDPGPEPSFASVDGFTHVQNYMVDRRGWLSLEACGESPQKRPWLQVADAVVRIYLCQVQGKPLRISISQRGKAGGMGERSANLGSADRGAVAAAFARNRTKDRPFRKTDDGGGGRQRASTASPLRRKKEERKKNGHFLQTLSDGRPDHRSTAQRTA